MSFFDEKTKRSVPDVFRHQELVLGLPRSGFHVGHGPRIRRRHLEGLSHFHLLEGLVRLHHGHRAQHSLAVESLIWSVCHDVTFLY